ncbi:MAG: T9SS type A sorting domain-containing protein [Bacteroidetes bacterium]|nr:T9SS type A sorting domain-containing protein [Bacteroidota bacterium]
MKKLVLFLVILIQMSGLNAQNLTLKERRQEAIDQQRMMKMPRVATALYLRDSSLSYPWIQISSSWSTSPDSRVLYEYDNQGRETAYKYFKWHAASNDWQNSYEYRYAYDANGNMTEWIFNQWDTVSNAWIPNEHDYLTYNSSNILTKETWNFYNTITHNWFIGYSFLYNDAGVLVEDYYYFWNYNTFVIEDGYRSLTTLDIQNRPVEYLDQILDTASNNWVNNAQTLSDYDMEHLTKETMNMWMNSNWVLMSQSLYSYTNNLKSEVLTQYWIDGSMEWIDGSKTVYSYNSANLITQELMLNWDGISWLNSQKISYSYDEANRITEKLTQRWINNNWVNSRQYIYAFDSRGNRIEYYTKSYNTSTAELTYGYHYLYTYDANNLNTLTYTQSWNTSLSDWINVSKTLVFYQKFPFGIPGNSLANCNCTFENPYIAGRYITCPSLAVNTEYEISVYSVSGSLVFQCNFHGGEGVKIDKQLPQGLYVMAISNQHEIIYRSKLIISPRE